MNQIEYINKILEIATLHPNAQIKLCVDGDDVAEYGWTEHEIDKVELRPWVKINERIYTYEDDAKSEISEMLYYGTTENRSEEEFDNMINEYYNKHVIEAICVFTSAPW